MLVISGGVSNLTTIVSPNLLTDYKTGVLFHQADQAYRTWDATLTQWRRL